MAVTKRDSKAELMEEVHKAYKKAEAYEKAYWKIDILNDNLYIRAYWLWIALLISLIFNFIQFFNSWPIC